MKPACPRLFEAEALRDGRLAGAELAAYERHLGVCPQCSHEVEALRTLGEALRAHSPRHAEADELHVRRERTRLLAAFDSKLVPSRNSRPRWIAALALASVLVLAALLVLRGSPPSLVPPATVAVVHADSTASWSRRVEGSLEKIVLERGALSINVHGGPGRPRLLVILPDGELEDIGTRFTVSADAGRTTRVSVQSGSVVLRLTGRPALALGAGETWSPPALPSAPLCSSCAPAVALAPAPSGSVPASRRVADVLPRALASAQAPSPALPQPGAASSLDFRAAVAALDRGDPATAAARFAAFLAEHPRDARAEDAAYLRVIALQRTGNLAAMNEAAAHYLRRFPQGFRRAEIEGLSAPPTSSSTFP